MSARWTQAELDVYLKKREPAADDDAPDARDEKHLQRDCEAWLEAVGFRRRSQREIQRHHAGLWFVHLNKTKSNPILLDLLLIDSTGGAYDVRALEVELKVEGGKLTPEQRCLTIRGEGVLCWSLREFQDAVRIWRMNCNKVKGKA